MVKSLARKKDAHVQWNLGPQAHSADDPGNIFGDVELHIVCKNVPIVSLEKASVFYESASWMIQSALSASGKADSLYEVYTDKELLDECLSCGFDVSHVNIVRVKQREFNSVRAVGMNGKRSIMLAIVVAMELQTINQMKQFWKDLSGYSLEAPFTDLLRSAVPVRPRQTRRNITDGFHRDRSPPKDKLVEGVELRLVCECVPVVSVSKDSIFHQHASKILQAALQSAKKAESLYQYCEDDAISTACQQIGLSDHNFVIVRFARALTAPSLHHIRAVSMAGKRSIFLSAVVALFLNHELGLESFTKQLSDDVSPDLEQPMRNLLQSAIRMDKGNGRAASTSSIRTSGGTKRRGSEDDDRWTDKKAKWPRHDAHQNSGHWWSSDWQWKRDEDDRDNESVYNGRSKSIHRVDPPRAPSLEDDTRSEANSSVAEPVTERALQQLAVDEQPHRPEPTRDRPPALTCLALVESFSAKELEPRVARVSSSLEAGAVGETIAIVVPTSVTPGCQVDMAIKQESEKSGSVMLCDDAKTEMAPSCSSEVRAILDSDVSGRSPERIDTPNACSTSGGALSVDMMKVDAIGSGENALQALAASDSEPGLGAADDVILGQLVVGKVDLVDDICASLKMEVPEDSKPKEDGLNCSAEPVEVEVVFEEVAVAVAAVGDNESIKDESDFKNVEDAAVGDKDPVKDESDFENVEDVESYGGSEIDDAELAEMLFQAMQREQEEDPAKNRTIEDIDTQICLKSRSIFPQILWRNKDMLVVTKPADWICTAADIDVNKGGNHDSRESVTDKGFRVLDDLLQHRFGVREQKYIHWWLQLTHDMDRASYPALFDSMENYGLCHRLDRETSGTLLVGLTPLARHQIRECFHRHYVRKMYVCLVHGRVQQHEQTVDRNVQTKGRWARLHASGQRARTHVKVFGYYTKTNPNGTVDDFTLCTCEIAEGRMHQIRIHMASALGHPIVSEFIYQDKHQTLQDRRWCQRTYLHAYVVGFPDVSGETRRMPACEWWDGGTFHDPEIADKDQEWHSCVCPLTLELRQALRGLTPWDEKSEQVLNAVVDTGRIDVKHESVHVMGTNARNDDIDRIFFPWSSTINPIDEGDLAKTEEQRKGAGKGARKGNVDYGSMKRRVTLTTGSRAIKHQGLLDDFIRSRPVLRGVKLRQRGQNRRRSRSLGRARSASSRSPPRGLSLAALKPVPKSQFCRRKQSRGPADAKVRVRVRVPHRVRIREQGSVSIGERLHDIRTACDILDPEDIKPADPNIEPFRSSFDSRHHPFQADWTPVVRKVASRRFQMRRRDILEAAPVARASSPWRQQRPEKTSGSSARGNSNTIQALREAIAEPVPKPTHQEWPAEGTAKRKQPVKKLTRRSHQEQNNWREPSGSGGRSSWSEPSSSGDHISDALQRLKAAISAPLHS